MKEYVVVGITALVLILVGCEKESFDQRLVDIAVNQGDQEDDIGLLARRVEGIDRRLQVIQQSLDKITPPSGAPETPKATEEQTTELPVVEFKDAPEYKQIVALLSGVQQQLNLTQSNLVETQENIANQEERDQMRDPRQAMTVISNPQQLSERLDSLVRNFGQAIEDPVRRQEFEAEVHQFRRSLSENPSTRELYQQTMDELTQRLNNEQNDRAREWIEREIRSLESATGEELAGRLERQTRFQNLRQLRDLTRKYDIPRDALTDAGLPAMGREEGRSREGRGQRGGR